MPEFLIQLRKLAKRYKSLKSDLQVFQKELLQNPFAGTDLGQGIRKVRMAISDKGKGKSHGARVITFTYVIDEDNGVIDLLYIYDKKDVSNISKSFIKRLFEEAKSQIED